MGSIRAVCVIGLGVICLIFRIVCRRWILLIWLHFAIFPLLYASIEYLEKDELLKSILSFKVSRVSAGILSEALGAWKCLIIDE